MTKAIKIFEYKKNNNKYWDRTKLHEQVVSNALPIVKALYPGYLLIFLFNNVTSHFVYVKDVLCIRDINKSLKGKQPYLYNN